MAPKLTTTTIDTAPQNAVAIPTETFWTVRVEVADTYGFTPTFGVRINGPGIFGTSRFTLANNETSAPVSRNPGTDWAVSLDGLGTGVDYSWVCTGDLSGPQVGSGSSYVPDATPVDTAMNCVVTVTDPTPTTLTIVSDFSGSPATGIEFDIDYGDRRTTTAAIGDVTLTNGQSATYTLWPSEAVIIRVAEADLAILVDVSCAAGGATVATSWFFPRQFSEIVGFRLANGANVTCTISHAVPPSLTVVEDVVPDGLGAPASSYVAVRGFNIESGPSIFALADGESQTVFLTPDERMGFSRNTPIELTSSTPVCVRLLAGGATEPYTPERAVSDVVEVVLAVGDDVVCTFTSQQSPPPTLQIDNDTLAIDPTIYDSFSVAVTDAGGALIDTYAVSVEGSSARLPLPSDGDYTLTVTNEQNLLIQWDCGSSAGGGLGPVTSEPATTVTTRFGESISCDFDAVEELAAGTASLTIDVDVVPDSTISTVVRVALGGRPVFSSEPAFLGDTAVGFEGDGSVSGSGLPGGTYSVVIRIPPSHAVTSFTCNAASALVSSEVLYVDGGVDGLVFTYSVDVPDGGTIVCSVVEEPAVAGAFLTVFNDVVPDTGAEFDYGISPAVRVTSGPASFGLGNGGVRSMAIQADQALTLTQTGAAGYTSSVECYDRFFNIVVSGTTSVTFTPVADDAYECSFFNEATAPSISVRTETVPAAPLDFDYAVTPVGSVTSANATFAQANGASTDVALDAAAVFDPESFFGTDPYVGPNVPTISQSAAPSYSTSTGCYDPAVAAGPTFVDGLVATPDPRPGQNLVCVFRNTLRAAPATIIVNTVEQTPAPSAMFEYSASPGSGIAVGPTSFVQADAASQSLTVDVGTPITIAQLGAGGYTTTVECLSDLGGPGTGGLRTIDVTAAAAGETITCTFTNVPLPTVELTIDVVVDTGVVDEASGFSFAVEVSGSGVGGDTGLGTDRMLDLGDADVATVSVLDGTEVTLAEVDALAGPGLFRTTIDCGAAASPITNAASTFTIVADTACTVTFAARTVTVAKRLDGPVVGGFDIFDFSLQPALGGTGDFFLGDGEREVLVVPFDAPARLIELDPGPYDVEIDCTVQTATGPTLPSTGPREFSNSIDLVASTNSYFCEVFNSFSGPFAQEVIITSVVDLGQVATPPDLPGFFVDLDGDFDFEGEFPGEFPQLNTRSRSAVAGPGSTSLSMVSSFAKSAIGRSEFLNANGTLSVFVADGGDLTIGAGAGSGRYANSFDCDSGAVSASGSVTLTNIGATVRCDLTSAAGVLQVEQVVNGSTSVTDWPFSITEVIAGDASVSLAASSRSLSAVSASQPLMVTLDDARGAQSVTRSCSDAAGLPLRFSGGTGAFQPVLSAAGPNSIAVAVPGGEVWRCTFTLTYADPITPTTTTVPTVPTTAPATTTPTITPVTVPTTTPSSTPTSTTPSTVATTTTTTAPIFPFSPAGPATTTPTVVTPATTTGTTTSGTVAPPSNDLVTTTIPPADDTTATTEPPTTEPPTTGTPADEPPSTEPPVATPDPVITEIDVPEDIYVDIGDPIPVDVECDGELVITVNGERQDRVDRIEPSTLGLGDHVINVACDGEQITSVRAVVFEQEESSPAGRNMTVIVMFVVMASAGFLFAPSAAGRKRLPV